MQAIDRLITEQWVDVYSLFGVSRALPFRLQNKGSDWITIQSVNLQPIASSSDGIVLRTFDSLIITPDGGGCWVRVTNNTVVNAVITYHPMEGILFQDPSSGTQQPTTPSSSSLSGVMPTMMKELPTTDYTPSVVVQFPSGHNHLDRYSVLTGDIVNPATVTYSASEAVIQSPPTGRAFLTSKKNVKCSSGQQIIANFTLSADPLSQTSLWGIGGGTGSCIAFAIENGIFGILWNNGATSTFIPQTSFNKDKLDGTGSSTKTVDLSSVNEFRIVTGLSNSLPIAFEWYSGVDKGYVTAHVIDSSVIRPLKSTIEDTLPLFIGVVDNSRISVVSMSALVSGKETEVSKQFNFTVSDKNIVATVPTYVASIRNNSLFNGVGNKLRVEILNTTLCSDGARSFKWCVYKNSSLSGASFVDVYTGSCVSHDVVATSFSTSQQTLLDEIITSKNQSVSVDEIADGVILYPNDTLTLAVSSSGNGTVGCVIRWKEIK